ncbi:uncharacterized RNA methyltransferase pc1998 [Phoenix dactylifera]|uniref:Uncharacterized RNA methyltransferase pc1998 n=1 Tax=Phoenix dactylifera TaxID=42345 RepID=A0A8B8ZSC3_PHODC|nr:uncharacterized RNA methyltransferase pc1998 [Phoenix dactylifera]XP_038974335.1 uncharacterized RNA methyltransferase pc1998 [Phoenix dactylifera]XP_038974336.1 uncharacterized RNA methyltransferase pc1998 [Phoenix dactylifera]
MALSLFSPALVTARLSARNPVLAVATSHLPSRNPDLLLESPSSYSAPTALQCPHFQSCSGCSYEWNLDQPPVLQEVSKFFRDHGIQDFTFDSGRLWEWRCRAKLAVRGTPESPLIGLYQEGTHNIVDIPLCRAHHPRINAAVELLKQGISKLNIQPYDEDAGTGDLRYVQMAVTTYNTSLPVAERYQKGKVQFSLVWNSRNEHSENSNKLHALSNFLWRIGGPNSNTHLIHSIWANFQTSTSNIIFGNRWRHLLGERDFWEHIGGVDISLDPSSFGQANTLAFNSLIRKLQKYVPYGSSVVDLYAGAGIIGLSVCATRKCRSVKCVEINKESKVSFEKSVSRLPKTIDCSISWHNTDASVEPLYWLEGSEVVVVDPPRKGLHPSLIDALCNVALSDHKSNEAPRGSIQKVKDEKRPWILRSREASVRVDSKTAWEKSQTFAETLIYISCGWESFKEDCRALLSSKAWHLEKAHAFNLFPGTESIEVLGVFKRGPRVGQKKKKRGKTKRNK